MFKDLTRIADALERIADKLGAPATPDPDSPPGSLLSQTDEEMAHLERLDARRAAGEYIPEEEE